MPNATELTRKMKKSEATAPAMNEAEPTKGSTSKQVKSNANSSRRSVGRKLIVKQSSVCPEDVSNQEGISNDGVAAASSPKKRTTRTAIKVLGSFKDGEKPGAGSTKNLKSVGAPSIPEKAIEGQKNVENTPTETATQQLPNAASISTSKAGSQFRPLLTLGVETGIFLVLATHKNQNKIRGFLVPCNETGSTQVVARDVHYFAAHEIKNVRVYVVFIAWPGKRAQALDLIADTQDGKQHKLKLDHVDANSITVDALKALIKPYSKILSPAFSTVFPKKNSQVEKSGNGKNGASSENIETSKLKIISAGCFDTIAEGVATGWACCKSDHNIRLTIELEANGIVLASGIADIYRQDLRDNNIGDGYHGFRIELPDLVRDGRTRVVTARIKQTGKLLSEAHQIHFECDQAFLDDVVPSEVLAGLKEALPGKAKPNSKSTAASVLFQTGCDHLENLQYSEARAQFSSLLQAYGPQGIVLCKIGETFLKENDLENAKNYFMQASLADRPLPWAYLGMGHVMRLLGKILEAEYFYRIALALNSWDVGLRHWVDLISDKASQAQRHAPENNALINSAVQIIKRKAFESPYDQELWAQLGHLMALDDHVKRSPFTSPKSLIAREATRYRILLETVLEEAERRKLFELHA